MDFSRTTFVLFAYLALALPSIQSILTGGDDLGPIDPEDSVQDEIIDDPAKPEFQCVVREVLKVMAPGRDIDQEMDLVFQVRV